MDDDAVLQAINEALKANKFEPKGNSKAIAKLQEDLEKLRLSFKEMDNSIPPLKDGLAIKADKRDLQKLVRFVKEQLERPENAIFTGKPLYGFKCMSCDHAINKLSRVTGDSKPTNRMPPQILPMLSAERIYSLEKRRSNSPYGPPSPNSTQQRKSWVGAVKNYDSDGTASLNNGNLGTLGEKRPQRVTPTKRGTPK
ncbi:hypothetical protein KP509_1Z112900 [Ceratopteris richardii]|nr:hypothetical protein KP509_1Z112900 [Ceratopteris richardii]